MKKLLISILALSSMVFANDNAGAADALASLILPFVAIFILGFFGAIFINILAGVCEILEKLCEAIGNLWEHLNSFGRAVIFGIPLFALSTTVFYFIGCFISASIPVVAEHWKLILCIIGAIYYLSTWITGFEKSDFGTYTIISRMIATLPFIPVIVLGWAIINGFGKMFMKDYKVSNILKVWNPYTEYRYNNKNLNTSYDASQLEYSDTSRYEFINSNNKLIETVNKQIADTTSFSKLGKKVSWIFDNRINDLTTNEIKQIDCYYNTYFKNWYSNKMNSLENKNLSVVNEICMK